MIREIPSSFAVFHYYQIKADAKKGFTNMTAVELLSSSMLPPFVVFDGTKLKTAKNPERTLAHKYRNWRNSKPGRTGHMCFHPKHWFDADVTVEWFEWLLHVVYPGKKVGVSMDQAP